MRMTSTTALGPPHHSHFAHHVRTRGWGIEPGWKFVNKDSQTSYYPPPSSDFIDPTLRRSFRIKDPSITTFSKDRFSNYYDSGSRYSSSSSSSNSNYSGSLGRTGSFRDRGRTIEIKLVDSTNTHYSRNGVGLRSRTDDDCPIHSAYRSASLSSSLPSRYSTLPRAQKPMPFPTGTMAVENGFSSLRVSPPTVSPPTGEIVPPGVLKKPGSYRGPKHMKKVAFLENAEFSRGIP